MKDAPKTERIIVPMSLRLVKQIDDWRFANRVPNRAEAIRQLIESSLNTSNEK